MGFSDMERVGVFDWKCLCTCAVLCCRRRGEWCNQGPDRDRDLVLHCAAVLSPALHPWLRSGCQDHRAHQDPAVWEGKASHACWCIVSCCQTLSVPWSTAVWEGKESHVYWCIGSCYQTLSVLWNTAVLEEKASHAYCCVVSCCQMLSVLWSTAGWGGKAVVLIVE